MQRNGEQRQDEQQQPRFGAELRATDASYRQALWGTRRTDNRASEPPVPTDRATQFARASA